MTAAVPFLDLRSPLASIRVELDQAYALVMDSGQYVLGPELSAFEEEFARYCEAEHCVGVGNGMEALQLVLHAWGIGAGDEVIVPAHTYIATWLAVTYCGAHPVPVEPREDTYNIDPGRIEAAITRRTRAIIAVHLYGQPADIDPINTISRRCGLKILEDAAQGHGARYYGRRTGGLADAACFSFYPSKNLGAFGDGGAVTTNDADLARRLRRLRNYGSDEKYVHSVSGFNSRLDELQASFLRIKLRHLDAWNARRSQVAQWYFRVLPKSFPDLVLPKVPEWAEPCWHQFVVRTPERDSLQIRLAARGVSTLIHYPTPPHRQPAYRDQGFEALKLPCTESLSSEVLSLPMGPHLDESLLANSAFVDGGLAE